VTERQPGGPRAVAPTDGQRVDPRVVHLPQARPEAVLVVYGIAHAGAGAAPWNPVAASAPPGVEVRALRLPGRENRITVPRHAGIDAAAGELAGAIAADAAVHGKPVLVAGACSGVLLGLPTLDRLRTAGVPVAGLLCLRPPTPDQVALTAGRGVASMSSAALRSWLRDNRLTPPQVLDNDMMYRFFEPVLRNDFAMIDGYRYGGGPLSCPIYLVRTRDAPDASAEEAWHGATTGPVRCIDLDVSGDPLTEHPRLVGELLGSLR